MFACELRRERMRRLAMMTVMLTWGLLMAPLAVPARAANCDPRAQDLCQQMDQTKQRADDTQARLDQIKSQIQDLEAKDQHLAQLVRELQGKVDAQKKAVAETQAKVDDTSRKIRYTQADITRREAHLAVRQQLLDQRVRTLANHDSNDYLSILVTATSFTQLIDRIGLMQDIVQSDQKMVGDLRQERDHIKGLKDQLDGQKAQLSGLLQQQKDEQSKLEADLRTQQQALDYQKQLEDQLAGQRQAMESELSNLHGQLDGLRQQYQDKIGTVVGSPGVFAWPMDSRYITQPFGCTDLLGEPYSPTCPTHHTHTGVDIAGPDGSPIFAAASGVVIYAGWNSGGYGNRTIIAHPGGYTTTYNHQSSIGVSVGQSVQQGQVIGREGSTGFSTGPHLHFEVLLNDNFQDPCPYLKC
jgi:murein DD-endopeptidase MepM/ murein hydrolase activator NlpD